MRQKTVKSYWNPGIWVLIWEYTVRAIIWIPTWQGLDGSQNLCALVLWTKVASALEGFKIPAQISECHCVFLKEHSEVLLIPCHHSGHQDNLLTTMATSWLLWQLAGYHDNLLTMTSLRDSSASTNIPHLNTSLITTITLKEPYTLSLTLPMLRLPSSKAQRRKDFWKPSKTCHFGIH